MNIDSQVAECPKCWFVHDHTFGFTVEVEKVPTQGEKCFYCLICDTYFNENGKVVFPS